MKFQKKINNSVAWVEDENGERFIAMGKGISFGKEFMQEIPENEIERIFKQDNLDPKQKRILEWAVDNLSYDVMLLAEEVSDEAAKALGKDKFEDRHFFALADHLNFSLMRSSENIDYPENVRWEIQRMYPAEYEAAVESLNLIEKRTGIRLPISEQTYLTYHFVNAQYDMNVSTKQTLLTEMINRSIEIIQYHYQIILNRESVSYIRFVTHLRYFILRQLNQEVKSSSLVDNELIEIVQKNYRKAFQASEKVGKMLTLTTGVEVQIEELFYLTLHIERVTKSE